MGVGIHVFLGYIFMRISIYGYNFTLEVPYNPLCPIDTDVNEVLKFAHSFFAWETQRM